MTRTKIFVSYSHEDSQWLKRLQKNLAPLQREGLVDLWDDDRIAAGDDWRKEIEAALENARVAVLLISSSFLASKFVTTNELPRLLERAENDGLIILPVNVGQDIPFSAAW